MKIYQVEIQTEDKSELVKLAIMGNRQVPFNLTNRTFGTKEKALDFLRECEKAYQFLQSAAGLGRLQTMRFAIKEYEVEE